MTSLTDLERLFGISYLNILGEFSIILTHTLNTEDIGSDGKQVG